jgi:hypothetical protein
MANSSALLQALLSPMPRLAGTCNSSWALEVQWPPQLRHPFQNHSKRHHSGGDFYERRTVEGRTLSCFGICKKSGTIFMQLMVHHLGSNCSVCKHTGAPSVLKNWPYDPKAAVPWDARRLHSQPAPPIIIIARNPYTRFLAGFLEKGADQLGFGSAAKLKRDERLGRSATGNLSHMQVSFRTAIMELGASFERHGAFWSATLMDNPHFWPQTSMVSDLMNDCNKGAGHGSTSVVVLHQERQADWFECFTAALGIPWSALARGWEGVRNFDVAKPNSVATEILSDCYWHPPGMTCSAFYGDISMSGSGGRRLQYESTKDRHSTHATSRVSEMYDAVSARTVHRVYWDDFTWLGYPVWDGMSPFLLD